MEQIYYEDGDIKIIPPKSVNNEESEEDAEDETELSLAELLEKYANEEDDEVNDPDYVVIFISRYLICFISFYLFTIQCDSFIW